MSTLTVSHSKGVALLADAEGNLVVRVEKFERSRGLSQWRALVIDQRSPLYEKYIAVASLRQDAVAIAQRVYLGGQKLADGSGFEKELFDDLKRHAGYAQVYHDSANLVRYLAIGGYIADKLSGLGHDRDACNAVLYGNSQDWQK